MTIRQLGLRKGALGSARRVRAGMRGRRRSDGYTTSTKSQADARREDSASRPGHSPPEGRVTAVSPFCSAYVVGPRLTSWSLPSFSNQAGRHRGPFALSCAPPGGSPLKALSLGNSIHWPPEMTTVRGPP
jgi:hypothetical protein